MPLRSQPVLIRFATNRIEIGQRVESHCVRLRAGESSSLGRQREAVVEPGQAIERVRFGPFRRGRVTHLAGDAAGVVEFPDRARLQLHAGGAQRARRFVAAGKPPRNRRPMRRSARRGRRPSSIAMQAPCASDCSVGCAASPSSVTRPWCQCRIGSRSQTAQRRSRSIIASSAFIAGMGVAVGVLQLGAIAARRRPAPHRSSCGTPPRC